MYVYKRKIITSMLLRVNNVWLVEGLRTTVFFAVLWAFMSQVHDYYVRARISVYRAQRLEYHPDWPDYAALARKAKPKGLSSEMEREVQWRRTYWKDKEYITVQYVFTDGQTGMHTRGRPFNVNVSTLIRHRVPFRRFVKTSRDLEEAPLVFVTASSVNHVYETMDAVASVQRFFPDSKILYYDWGLKPWQVWDIKRWCNVEVRKFNFAEYPVPSSIDEKNATRYQSAKVFAILDALQDHPRIIWMDASVRFVEGNLSAIEAKARENKGFVFFSMKTNHSTYSVTHPKTFQYLPSSLFRQKVTAHFESNALLIMRTKEIYDNILWFWYLCAMHQDCIAPTLNVACNFREMTDHDKWFEYMNCTRADQSVINILASNYLQFNTSRYFTRGDIIIRRKMTKMFKLNMCYGPTESMLVAP